MDGGRCDGAICWLTFTPATDRRYRQAYGSKVKLREMNSTCYIVLLKRLAELSDAKLCMSGSFKI